jgi:hypothetical protein
MNGSEEPEATIHDTSAVLERDDAIAYLRLG